MICTLNCVILTLQMSFMHLEKCCILPSTNFDVACRLYDAKTRHIDQCTSYPLAMYVCIVHLYIYPPPAFFHSQFSFLFSIHRQFTKPLLRLSLSEGHVFSGVQLLQLQLFKSRQEDIWLLVEGGGGRGVHAPRTGFLLVMRGEKR